jgi:hypothetical protein
MKKILILLLVLSSCTPLRYVMIDPKDSSKLVEVRKRIIYEDIYQPSIPLYFYNGFYAPQYQRPIIIQRPIVISKNITNSWTVFIVNLNHNDQSVCSNHR